jgi:hypothetical protein
MILPGPSGKISKAGWESGSYVGKTEPAKLAARQTNMAELTEVLQLFICFAKTQFVLGKSFNVAFLSPLATKR